MLEREGHFHLKKLKEIFKHVTDEYVKQSAKYIPHTVINRSSLELLPIKLNEISFDEFMKKRKMVGNDPFWKVYNARSFFRHLLDHMFLIIHPEIMNKANKETFLLNVNKVVDFTSQSNREIFSKMSDKTITSTAEYFLAHVKNDIEILKSELQFENPVDIFDWLRAVMTKIIEKLHNNQKVATNHDLLIDEMDIVECQKLLIYQEEEIRNMENKELSNKHVIKNMIFRKVDGPLLKTFMKKFGYEHNYLYKFMRHNRYSRTYLIEEFGKQLQTSQYAFLKKVVKYANVLTEFPRMVKANLDLVYYLMNNYNRIYNFDDASE